jgi:hypothetical protein
VASRPIGLDGNVCRRLVFNNDQFAMQLRIRKLRRFAAVRAGNSRAVRKVGGLASAELALSNAAHG